MMIALPNLDRSFTCTLFWPKGDFDALGTPDKVTAYFEEHYPDVAGLMPDLTDDYAHNPIGSLVTVRPGRGPGTGTARRWRCSATPRTRSSRSSGRAPTARSRTASKSTAA